MRINSNHLLKQSLFKIVKQFTPWLAFVGLVCYGAFYHISSSEFWPITMSKTWLPGEIFEYSMLQKPLFTLFLAIFHAIPLNDTQHLLLLKFIFSLLGFFSIYFFVRALSIFTNSFFSKFKLNFLFLLTILTPTLLNNFFRIRADQLTLFFVSFFLYFLSLKKHKLSIFFSFLALLTSIKSIIFLPLILIFLFNNYKSYLYQAAKRNILFIGLASASILVWMIALNIGSLYYFIGTFNNQFTINNYLKKFLLVEFPFLLISIILSINFLIRKNNNIFFKLSGLASIYSTLLILLNPQSYPFYISSLLLFAYGPLLIWVLNKQQNTSYYIKLFIITAAVFIYSYSIKIKTYSDEIYRSNTEQIIFIDQTSSWLQENTLTYLDGMGTMPRQHFIRCFVSPNDDLSNSSCRDMMYSQSSDIIIITQRLAYFSQEIFSFLEKNYSQVEPNIWIKNNLKNKIKFTPRTSNIKPIFIFDFEG